MKKGLEAKLKKVRLLLMDVDGVLTKGDIVYDFQGKEIKFFNVHDGFAIVLFRKEGFKTAVLTARYCEAVQVRMEDLGVDKIVQDAFPKMESYRQIVEDLNVSDEEVCFVADDLTDLAILKRVGVAVAVPNAVDEVKEHADHITKKEGGNGAVREVVEMILQAQGKWKGIIESFS